MSHDTDCTRRPFLAGSLSAAPGVAARRASQCAPCSISTITLAEDGVAAMPKASITRSKG